MSIKRINEFPEGSGSLTNDDIFLFMDNPSGSGVTKKISLSQISNIIGGRSSVLPSGVDGNILTYSSGNWIASAPPSSLPSGIENNILLYSSGSWKPSSDINLNRVSDIGLVADGSSAAINAGPNLSIQTLTINGGTVTFTKGTGWPSTNTISTDVLLKITVSSLTTIIWSIVTEWFNNPNSGALSVGTHLVLLRGIGNSTVEAHYIGNKTS